MELVADQGITETNVNFQLYHKYKLQLKMNQIKLKTVSSKEKYKALQNILDFTLQASHCFTAARITLRS